MDPAARDQTLNALGSVPKIEPSLPRRTAQSEGCDPEQRVHVDTHVPEHDRVRLIKADDPGVLLPAVSAVEHVFLV